MRRIRPERSDGSDRNGSEGGKRRCSRALLRARPDGRAGSAALAGPAPAREQALDDVAFATGALARAFGSSRAPRERAGPWDLPPWDERAPASPRGVPRCAPSTARTGCRTTAPCRTHAGRTHDRKRNDGRGRSGPSRSCREVSRRAQGSPLRACAPPVVVASLVGGALEELCPCLTIGKRVSVSRRWVGFNAGKR
jgi:hypothetical protein